MNKNFLEKVLRDTEPKNREQLKNYINMFFDFDIPHIKVCPDHTTPLDFIHDCYFGDYSNILAIGERDGYKTLAVSILAQLKLKFKACSILQAGAIEQQARKGYEYLTKYLQRVQPENLISSLMSETRLKNGAKIQIAPATENRMNSEHCPLLILDELELIKPNAYKESKGIPARQKSVLRYIKSNGEIVEKCVENKPQTIKITSRKRAFGLAQQEIDNADKLGLKLMLWCYKETTEKCPKSRRGELLTNYWIDREALISISNDEYKNLSDLEKQEYDKFTAFEGCTECPLLPSCCGDLSRAGGIKKIDDVVSKFLEASASFWISQKESRRAMGEGGVFTKYLKKRHLINKRYSLNPALPIYRFLDFGHRVSNIGYGQVNSFSKKPVIHIFEYSQFEDISTFELVNQIKKIDLKWGISERNVHTTFPDAHHGNQKRSNADYTDIEILTSKEINGYANIKCEWSYYSVKAGIEVIREYLKIVCGEQFVYFYKDSEQLYNFMLQYCWEYSQRFGIYLDRVAEDQPSSHAVDAFRYLMINLFAVNKPKLRRG
jgi:hypothetical protein